MMFVLWLNKKIKIIDFFYLVKNNMLISIDMTKLNLLIIKYLI